MFLRTLPKDFRVIALVVILAAAAWALGPAFVAGRLRPALDPTGIATVLFLFAAMAISPLRAIAPASIVILRLVPVRKLFGLAAFGFGCMHLLLIGLALGKVSYLIEGMAYSSIWTGWVALLLMLPAALTSTRATRLQLGRWWKRIQRLAWPAAGFAIAHWYLQTWGDRTLFWIATGTLAALETARLLRMFRARSA